MSKTKNINPFDATGLFLYPLKTSENQRFSGSIEREQWHHMVSNIWNLMIIIFFKSGLEKFKFSSYNKIHLCHNVFLIYH